MNNDITAQATASRQIAQRLRACRRNCPTTAARRSAALLRLTVSAKVAFSDRTVEQASAMCTVIVRSFWDGGYSSSLLRHEESCQYPQRRVWATTSSLKVSSTPSRLLRSLALDVAVSSVPGRPSSGVTPAYLDERK